MGLPGVIVNVQNGNLGLQAPSAEHQVVLVGCSPLGTPNVLAFYGDQQAMIAALDTGELCEAAAYNLAVAGGPVGVLPLLPDTPGGLSAVTHSGTGSGTLTVSSAPHKQIVLTITGTGSPGTGTFKYQVGTEPISASILIPAGLTYLVPGTYTVVTFTNASYTSADTYTLDVLGGSTHAGGGTSRSTTQASSPIDDYQALITVTTGGALATAQFTYALDGLAIANTVGGTSSDTSAPILSTVAGTYAIPGTGIVLTFAGTLTAGDSYTFTSCGPSSSQLSAALTQLETTYLSASYSLAAVLLKEASASTWGTQVTTLDTAALSLFNNHVYVRFFNCTPTVGTITASGGAVVVDSADTDTVLLTQRLSTASAHVVGGAGDCLLASAITGLLQRRCATWVAIARAAQVEASQNIGFVGLGNLPGVAYLYRNEAATPALDAVGYTTLRTYPGSIASGTGLPGSYFTDSHTLDSVTSDYYPLTNARVVDLGCTIAVAAALPQVLGKIPTTTRNGQPGVITNRKALVIEGLMNGALAAGLVDTEPQDAVAASASVNRNNNVLATSNLIIGVGIQPFAYARTITVNIGLTTAA